MLTRTRTSELLLWRACPRAWWYRAVAQLPTRQTAAMTRGTVAHVQLERWTTGEAPDALHSPAARVLASELQRHFQLPPAALRGGDKGPWDQVLPEWQWSIPVRIPTRAEPVEFTGCADLVLVMAGESPVLIDYKTRGQQARAGRWAPSAAELQTNVQLLNYANAVMRLLCRPAPDSVHLAHLNAYHEGKQAVVPELVTATADRDAIETTWEQTVLSVAEMALDHTKTQAEQVRADVTGTACDAYGGCPYRHRCSQYAHVQALPAGEHAMAMIPQSARPTPAPALDTSFPPADEPKQAPAPTPAPVREQDVRMAPDPDAYGRYVLTLCIDCGPVTSQGEALPIVRLEDYLQPLVAKLCELKKVGHYAAIPYGEGKALVAQLLAVNLPPSGSIVVADSALPLTPACIEVLSPLAGPNFFRCWR